MEMMLSIIKSRALCSEGASPVQAPANSKKRGTLLLFSLDMGLIGLCHQYSDLNLFFVMVKMFGFDRLALLGSLHVVRARRASWAFDSSNLSAR